MHIGNSKGNRFNSRRLFPLLTTHAFLNVRYKNPIHIKITPRPDSRAFFCREGVPLAIEQFTPTGGTPALHFKSPNGSGLGHPLAQTQMDWGMLGSDQGNGRAK